VVVLVLVVLLMVLLVVVVEDPRLTDCVALCSLPLVCRAAVSEGEMTRSCPWCCFCEGERIFFKYYYISPWENLR